MKKLQQFALVFLTGIGIAVIGVVVLLVVIVILPFVISFHLINDLGD